MSDAYADYWKQNVAHTRINYAYCVRNPLGFKGYGPNCWGLTAGDSVKGYDAHSPKNDKSVITPSAALASFPYSPTEAMAALRHPPIRREELLPPSDEGFQRLSVGRGWRVEAEDGNEEHSD